jgi:hypothetical protein
MKEGVVFWGEIGVLFQFSASETGSFNFSNAANVDQMTRGRKLKAFQDLTLRPYLFYATPQSLIIQSFY